METPRDDATRAARREALRRTGEKFMAMFDDAGDAGDARATRETTRDGDGKNRAGTSTARARDDATSRATRDARETRRKKSSAGSARAVDAAAGPTTMVFDGRRVTTAAAAAAAAKIRARDDDATRAVRKIDTKKARRAFMSADAGRVFVEDAAPAARGDGDDADGDDATAERLRALREEVQAFGVQGLNKWDRAALENKRLVDLGMKPKKGPRIPPAIGIGLAKANERRVEAARMEAFHAGYKLEKKAKKASAGDRDRGLSWGSTYSDGVMRVNKRDMVNQDKLVDTKAMLRSGGGGRAPKASGKKTKKKGKTGRKSKR